jgi:hypothetical protein
MLLKVKLSILGLMGALLMQGWAAENAWLHDHGIDHGELVKLDEASYYEGILDELFIANSEMGDMQREQLERAQSLIATNEYGLLFQLYPMSCDTQTGECVAGEVAPTGPFLNGGYFGLSFMNATGGLHYGWVHLEDNEGWNGHNYGHVLAHAYDSDAGVGIVVPEPGSVGMIMGGTAALMLYRRELLRSRKHPDDCR